MGMRLYVLYDPGCGLCSQLVQWMSEQPSAYQLRFVAGSSGEARRLFPELHSPARPEELVVVSGEGAVYRGEAAFIVCLYALNDYRPLAVRLARPAFRPLARRIFTLLSTHRMRLSDLLGLASDETLARAALTTAPEPLAARGEPVW
jgi:predicted DCC family thiol-disulfide oxidoreductase YuxK